jgi:TPP-dependent pyruvate/acetoin dehydrogenase alpha subunit
MLYHSRRLNIWLTILIGGGLLAIGPVSVKAQQKSPSDCERLAEFLQAKGLLSAQDLTTLNHRAEQTHEEWVKHWSATRVPPPSDLTNAQLAEFLKTKGLLSAQDLDALNYQVAAKEEEWVKHWSATRVPPSPTVTSTQLAEFLRGKRVLTAADVGAFEHGESPPSAVR